MADVRIDAPGRQWIAAALLGDLERVAADELAAAEKAIVAGVTRATDGLKGDWRRELLAAGLGPRASKAIQSRVYRNEGLDAAGRVFARGWSQPIIAHTEGADIRPVNADALAIPTDAAGPGPRGTKITPERWEQRTGLELRTIVRGAGKRPLLVATLRRRTGKHAGTFAVSTPKSRASLLEEVVVFVLAQLVRLPKRVRAWGRHVEDWRDRLPQLIVDAWRDPPLTAEERRARR